MVAETVLIGILPQYFDRYCIVAVSASICGMSLGSMILPPISELLLERYGWRGALLILGGINVHLLASGVILKSVKRNKTDAVPLIEKRQRKDLKHKSKVDISGISFSGCFEAIRVFLELNLLRNISFVVVLIISGVYGYTFAAWGIYIVSLLESKDLFTVQAVAVATAGGIGKLAVMMMMPPLNNRFGISFLMYLSSIIQFISMVMHCFIQSYTLLIPVSIVFGIGQGILSVEVYILGHQVAGEDKGVQAVTWIHLFYGLFGTFGGVITGNHAYCCFKMIGVQTSNFEGVEKQM